MTRPTYRGASVLDNSVDALKADVTALQDMLGSGQTTPLTDQVSSLTNVVTGMADTVNLLTTNVDELNSFSQTASGAIDTLNASVAAIPSSGAITSGLAARVDTAQSDIATLQSDVASVSSQTQTVSGSVISLQNAIQDAFHDKGIWDASTGFYPATPNRGDTYEVGTAGAPIHEYTFFKSDWQGALRALKSVTRTNFYWPSSAASKRGINGLASVTLTTGGITDPLGGTTASRIVAAQNGVTAFGPYWNPAQQTNLVAGNTYVFHLAMRTVVNPLQITFKHESDPAQATVANLTSVWQVFKCSALYTGSGSLTAYMRDTVNIGDGFDFAFVGAYDIDGDYIPTVGGPVSIDDYTAAMDGTVTLGQPAATGADIYYQAANAGVVNPTLGLHGDGVTATFKLPIRQYLVGDVLRYEGTEWGMLVDFGPLSGRVDTLESEYSTLNDEVAALNAQVASGLSSSSSGLSSGQAAADYMSSEPSYDDAAAAVDCNAFVAGMKVTVANQNANTPGISDTLWYIETLNAKNGTSLIQRAYGVTTGETWSRKLYGGVWGSWRKQWDTANFNPDNKLGVGGAAYDYLSSNPNYYNNASAVDCNAFVAGSKALVGSGNANVPGTSEAFWYVETANTYTGANRIQRAYGYVSAECWKRTCYNGTWGAWRKTWDSGNFDPTTKQNTLGFTPVQQGTGIGQLTNTVKFGWKSGSKLGLTIDSTDLGNVAMENWVTGNYAALNGNPLFAQLSVGADNDILLYETGANNGTLGVRTGSSSGYRYFNFGADGSFNILNGGLTAGSATIGGNISGKSFTASGAFTGSARVFLTAVNTDTSATSSVSMSLKAGSGAGGVLGYNAPEYTTIPGYGDAISIENQGAGGLVLSAYGGGGFSLRAGTNRGEIFGIGAAGDVTISGGTLTLTRAATDYNAISLTNTSGVQLQLNANGNAEGNLRTVTNHPLTMSTNNTQRLAIGTDGTITQASAFAGASLYYMINNTDATGYSTLWAGGDKKAGIFRNGASQTGYGGANSLNIGSTSGAYAVTLVTNNVVRMTIDGTTGAASFTGNVTISNGAIGSLAVVSSSTNAASMQLNNTSTGGHNWMVGSAGSSSVIPVGGFFIYDNTAGATRFSIDTSGNAALNGSLTAGQFYTTWPVATGTIANGGGGGNNGVVCHANNNGGASATSCAALTFIRDGLFGCFFGLDTDNQLKVGGWSFGNTSYRVVHEGLATVNLNAVTADSLSYGSLTRQMINLYATTYGIGVQSSTYYSRSGGGYAWFNNGVHSSAQNDPGTGGSVLMTLSSTGALTIPDRTYYTGLRTPPAGSNPGAIGMGNADSASYTGNNMAIYSWFGIGFGPSITGQPVANGTYSHYFNVRNGDMGILGSIDVGGIVSAGNRIWTGWDSGTAGSVSCSQWFRTTGNTGLYCSSWGGGWYMTDATYMRSYQNKAVVASDFVISSDSRLKAGIRPFEFKGRLRPVSYTMREDGSLSFGFVAQEVQVLYPEAVGVVPDTGMLQLSYSKLTTILSYQVNRVEDRVDDHDVQLAMLEDRYAAQQNEIDDLRRQLHALLHRPVWWKRWFGWLRFR